MFIPLRTNRPPKRHPIVTQTLIAVNMLVYLAGMVIEFRSNTPDAPTPLIDQGILVRDGFHAWQLVTYQFLHDPSSIWHLAFNMLFLWVFGAAVEDRLGRIAFLGFYLLGGAVAGAAHLMVSPAPVIGASGAVAAVTGAFLALFPRSHVQILFFFFIIRIISIPALWFVGLYFVLDVMKQVGGLLGAGGGERVAYMAHIAGYVYGFAFAFLLLAIGIVKREEFDIFYLFKQSRRRAAFRAAATKQVGGAWTSASADTAQQLERRAARAAPLRSAPTPAQIAQSAARTEIQTLVADHRLAEATARYRALLRDDDSVTLTEPAQLDVANQLQADGDFETAARAYQLLLDAYPRLPQATEVRLILALVYVRELKRPDAARALLDRLAPHLRDPDQRKLADELRAEIGE